jgi:hypothetical protein
MCSMQSVSTGVLYDRSKSVRILGEERSQVRSIHMLDCIMLYDEGCRRLQASAFHHCGGMSVAA